MGKKNIVHLTSVFALLVSATFVSAESNVTDEPANKEAAPSSELIALQKEVAEGEQMLAETRAEIESLKNQLLDSQQEHEKYQEEVKVLMKKLEEVQ